MLVITSWPLLENLGNSPAARRLPPRDTSIGPPFSDDARQTALPGGPRPKPSSARPTDCFPDGLTCRARFFFRRRRHWRLALPVRHLLQAGRMDRSRLARSTLAARRPYQGVLGPLPSSLRRGLVLYGPGPGAHFPVAAVCIPHVGRPISRPTHLLGRQQRTPFALS
jgi:hypothetical protein